MRPALLAGIMVTLISASASFAQPYDFSEADLLLAEALPDLSDHVAVLVRQDGVELYRFQAGDIDYDTKRRLASFTKTISGAVILSLADDGLLALDERIGTALPFFDNNGLGEATVLDAWAMRHGIDSLIAYERDSRFTLAESVVRIGLNGFQRFPAGTQLWYDGAGMQTVGWIAELRTGQPWEAIARARIFDPCQMPEADYGQFDPNPAVAGGMRSSALETIDFAQMIIDRGWFAGQRVLSNTAIEQMFTNHTLDLPIGSAPWPDQHPLYPYGVRPTYSFGAWVLAENPTTGHVEEIVGAGAWGSFIWIDRRRGVTAVLITDIPAGTQASIDAMLGLLDITRQQTDEHQASGLSAVVLGGQGCIRWQPGPSSTATRVYGSTTPIRNLFDLRAATLLTETATSRATVPPYDYYALTARYGALENTALTPIGNTATSPTVRPDLNHDGFVDADDFEVLAEVLGSPGPNGTGDVDRDGDSDLADVARFQQFFGVAGC